MHRLFVALRPPPEIRSSLLAAMGGVPGARWQSDAQLHITLRFIGEVDGHAAESIADTLAAIRHPALDLAIDGVGTFDRKGRIDALWARVAPNDSLHALHRKIDHALVRTGLPPETRAYKPHVTLARFGARGGDVSAFAQSHAGLSTGRFGIESFGLFESRLGSEGAFYAELAEYPLDDR